MDVLIYFQSLQRGGNSVEITHRFSYELNVKKHIKILQFKDESKANTELLLSLTFPGF